MFVEDCAAGLLLLHDKGRIGETYVLGGEVSTIGNAITLINRILGKKPPRFTVPRWVMKASTPLGPLVARMTGLPPNLSEGINAIDNVTYWATDQKARAELGYTARDMEASFRETLGVAG